MRRLIGYVAAAGLALGGLTGCTLLGGGGGGPGGETVGTSTGATGATTENATPTPTVGVDFGTANAGLSVMAQSTVAAGGNVAGNGSGGTVTAVLRAVEVSGDVLTVRFALQWDNPAEPNTTTAGGEDLGLSLSDLMAVDGATLTGYRPFCTDGAYDGNSEARIMCYNSQLVSPSVSVLSRGGEFHFPNHGLIEGFALLPAPEGHPTTLDIGLGAPFALFTGATVTYR
ncbi:MAG: hypothetical protein LBI33_04290 [Propionibacteriaceae bacterium]|nr:hypothetical protein [Propionibacteriaceae bacterium]